MDLFPLWDTAAEYQARWLRSEGRQRRNTSALVSPPREWHPLESQCALALRLHERCYQILQVSARPRGLCGTCACASP